MGIEWPSAHSNLPLLVCNIHVSYICNFVHVILLNCKELQRSKVTSFGLYCWAKHANWPCAVATSHKCCSAIGASLCWNMQKTPYSIQQSSTVTSQSHSSFKRLATAQAHNDDQCKPHLCTSLRIYTCPYVSSQKICKEN